MTRLNEWPDTVGGFVKQIFKYRHLPADKIRRRFDRHYFRLGNLHAEWISPWWYYLQIEWNVWSEK